MNPIEQYALLLLWGVQHDHATELVISPTAGAASPVRYKAQNAWQDWSPPPPNAIQQVIAELGRLAGFTEGPFPKVGIIDVPFSGVRLWWRVHMENPDSPCILTPIQE